MEAEVEITPAATLDVEGNPTECLHGCEMLDTERMRCNLGSNCCFSSRDDITLTRFPLAALNKLGGAAVRTFQLASQMPDRSL